ncbi:MAG: MFS transporter [Heyndrickxia sp.]
MDILKNKDFSFLLGTRLLTNIADSLFYIISMWYIASHFNSPFFSGLAVFCFTFPELLIFLIGPIIDRTNPKKLLIISNVFQIICLSFLILLYFTNMLNIGFLLIVIFISVFLSSITYPIEETMIPQIVKNDNLVLANSIFSIFYKVLDSLFNGLAGLLIASFSVIYLYKVNVLLFILPIICVYFVRFSFQRDYSYSYSLSQYKDELKDGYRYLSSTIMKKMLYPLVFINLFGAVNAVALPYFSKTFDNASIVYGLLLGVGGIGGMVGAILVNYVNNYLNPGRILTYGLFLNGLFWAIALIFHTKILIYSFLFLSYVCSGAYNIIFASLFQSMSPKHLLGRINSTIDTIITLAMPLGSLIGGLLLKFMVSREILLLYGITSIIVGIIYFLDKRIFLIPKIAEENKEDTNEVPSV